MDPLTAAKKYVEVSHPDAEIGSLVSYASLQAVAIGSILLLFVIVPIKISVLLFYKRIFTTQIFKRCIWVTISIVLAWGVASLVVCSDRSINASFPKF